MIRELIRIALEEDLGEQGDVTSKAIFTDETGIFTLFAKDTGVLCGTGVFCEVCAQVDSSIGVEFLYRDGDEIESGSIIARLSGRVLSILTAERTAVNFLSFLSGISTQARRYAEGSASVPESHAVILDTRKTLPGYRELSKYAVSCGGAGNHRRGLYDMVLIKDNHIDASGSIAEAVRRVRIMWGDRFKIEVEARTLEEVREALDCGVDRIMLDNMDTIQMIEAIAMVQGAAEVEASGNITLSRVPAVSSTGVDFISVGEITHSVKAFDFSLKQQNS